jgi:radical SAM-linked protein
MAYSSGFNPHPRISYAGAAPTGAASEAEFLEIGLARESAPEDVRVALDTALPPGLDVLEVVPSGGGSLNDRLEASQWRIRIPGGDRAAAVAAVAAFLARDELLVERMTKKGLRSFDARAAIASVDLVDPVEEPGGEPGDSRPAPGACAILDVVLRHGSPSVRPDDVLAALHQASGLRVTAALQQRLAQGPWDEENGTVGDPLAPDRDAAGQ